MQPFGDLCSSINAVPGTIISGIWFFISLYFSKYWYWIIATLTILVLYEVGTRNTHKYNSDNGFTPGFNSFVGSGIFFGFEMLINLILNAIFGNATECILLWTKSFYLIPFITTGIFLNLIGFWKYIRIPILNIKIDLTFHK